MIRPTLDANTQPNVNIGSVSELKRPLHKPGVDAGNSRVFDFIGSAASCHGDVDGNAFRAQRVTSPRPVVACRSGAVGAVVPAMAATGSPKQGAPHVPRRTGQPRFCSTPGIYIPAGIAMAARKGTIQ